MVRGVMIGSGRLCVAMLLLASTAGCLGDDGADSETEPRADGDGEPAGRPSEPSANLAREDANTSVEPRVTQEEWHGTLRCGLTLGGVSMAICSAYNVPGEETRHTIELSDDAEGVVIAMVWEPAPYQPVTGNGLRLIVHDDAGHSRADKSAATGPVEMRFDRGQDLPENVGGLDLRVWTPADDAHVTVEQSFTVHYHIFQDASAPDGYSALPN